MVVIFLYSGVHGGLDYDLSGASQSACAHGWGKRGGDITSSVVLAVIFNHTGAFFWCVFPYSSSLEDGFCHIFETPVCHCLMHGEVCFTCDTP